MAARDENIDYSVRLEPLAGPPSSRPPQSFWTSRWALALGVILGLSAMALTIAVAYYTLVDPPSLDPVATRRSVGEMNAESTAAFDKFVQLAPSETRLTGNELEEFKSIGRFAQELQKFSQEEDNEAFQTRVDFDRLYGRIEQINDLRSWNWIEKKAFRKELRETVDVEPEWRRLQIAAVLTPSDDAATRVVYAYGYRDEESLGENLRFWLAEDGAGWMLYDWENLDLGMSTSEEWAAYARHVDDPAWNGYLAWNDLIVQASEQSQAGNRDQAKEFMRQAENQRVPPTLDDYHWLLTGYLWNALGDSAAAQRCYHKVRLPEQTPGAYYELMKGSLWGNPRDALKYAEQYQQAVGLNNELCQTMARLHSHLDQDEEALACWKQVLRFEPSNTAALSAILISLPEDRKQEFAATLKQQDEPRELAAQVARYVSYQDEAAFAYLLGYLEKNDPKSSRTADLLGLAAEIRGAHLEASAHYLKALQLETDAEKQQGFVDSYLESALSAGKLIEAWDNVPDPRQAFHNLMYGFDDGYLEIAREELRDLIAIYRTQEPDDLWGVYYGAQLALDERDFQSVSKMLVAALDQQPNQIDDEDDRIDNAESDDEASDDEEMQYMREELLRQLAEAWHRTLPVAPAYQGLLARGASLKTIAGPLEDQLRWDDLETLLNEAAKQTSDTASLEEVRGDLASGRGRWSEAVKHYQTAMEQTEEDARWLLRKKYLAVCVSSGAWKAYYEQHEDEAEAFEQLTRRQIAEQRWEDFEALLQWHSQRSGMGANPVGNDWGLRQSQIAAAAARAAWACESYNKCAQYCDLAQGEERSAFPRSRFNPPPFNQQNGNQQNGNQQSLDSDQIQAMRQLKTEALIRLGNFSAATAVAKQLSDPDDQTVMQAVIAAAGGESREAIRFADQVAAQDDSLGRLYHHEYAGALFMGEEYRSLREEDPPTLPYQLVCESGVFFLKGPLSLSVEKVSGALRNAQNSFLQNRATAIEELDFQMLEMRSFPFFHAQQYGPNRRWPKSRIEEQHAKVLEAASATEPEVKFYVCTYDQASIWFATGTGEYDPTWRLARTTAESPSFDTDGKVWFAVGTIAWSEHDRERAAGVARRAAVRLVGDQANFFCVFDSGRYPSAAYVASRKAIEAWQYQIPQHRVGSSRVAIDQNAAEDAVIADRKLRRSLRDAVKQWRDGKQQELRLLVKLSDNRINASLWAALDDVEEQYGSMTFKVHLLETSKLLPMLREGLLLEIDQSRVESFKFMDASDAADADRLSSESL